MGQQALSPLSSGHIGNLFLDGSHRLTCDFNQLDPDTQSPKLMSYFRASSHQVAASR
jgi:hypothetical protein